MTKLSIVVPAYNVADYIPATLNAILRQNSNHIEVIVVDDGATDHTAQVVRDVLATSDAVNFTLLSKPNGGVSSARNHGLAHATGEYVLFLDGDDYIADGFVGQFLLLTEQAQPDLIHWPYDQVDEDGRVMAPFEYPAPPQSVRPGLTVLESMLYQRSTRACTISIAFRRELLTQHALRFTEGCRYGEDAELIYQALSHADTVLFTEHLRSLYVQRATSVMGSYSVRRFDAVEAMERVRDAWQTRPEPQVQKLAAYFDSHEILHYYAGSYRLSLQHLVDAEGMRAGQAMRKLNKDMDTQYPGLRERMRVLLATRRHGPLPDRLDVFRWSPRLYMGLSRWSDRLRRARKGQQNGSGQA